MLLYYITDRLRFSGTEPQRQKLLLSAISRAAKAGVEYIQLREKDLSAKELVQLAGEAVRVVRNESSSTKLLINSRTDIALAVGADGVHLASSEIDASEARNIAAKSRIVTCRLEPSTFIVAVSCHSTREVRNAESHGADFAVLAPVFEKHGTTVTPIGIEGLSAATTKYGNTPDRTIEAGDVRNVMPVFALGGITRENAILCKRAGAAGVAAIRMFQEAENLNGLVATLHAM